MEMFNFLSMEGTHDLRKVDTYEKENLFVDTCRVTDSDQPYETAVQHPKYNKNKLVIVEMYNTKEEAQKGHKKWVRKMTSKKLPKILKDVSTSGIAKLLEIFT